MITKLLAVDDSKTMRRVLEITFGGEEFQTTICGSSGEALAALRTNRPAFAVVDATLGSESGYELCRRIKAEAPEVRVLLLSSKQRPYDEAAGSGAGADGNFDKPFDSAKLLEKVNGLLGSAPATSVAAAPAAPAPVAAAPAPVARPASAPAPLAARPVLTSSAARPPAASPPVSAAPRPVVPSAAPRPAAPAVAAPPLSARPQVPAVAAAPVVAAVSSAAFSDKLKDLGLSPAQLEGVLSLSREVVEQVVWEVVPTLAETLIKEEIARLTAG